MSAKLNDYRQCSSLCLLTSKRGLISCLLKTSAVIERGKFLCSKGGLCGPGRSVFQLLT